MFQEHVVSTGAPIQSFPVELFREIFLKGLRTGDLLIGHDFALRVSWVCKRWRNIALDIHLWNGWKMVKLVKVLE